MGQFDRDCSTDAPCQPIRRGLIDQKANRIWLRRSLPSPCFASRSVHLTDFARYYDLEDYLFRDVSARFTNEKRLSAFDFFCIVIWKANRAKSKVAKRLLAQGHSDLEAAVAALAAAIKSARDNKERLRAVVEGWGFRLPIASAILTVLFPDDFTVYDLRVCEILGDFSDAQYKTQFEALWARYSAYVARVQQSVPHVGALRDKDRYLWGQSFAAQLQRDMESQFGNAADGSEFEALQRKLAKR